MIIDKFNMHSLEMMGLDLGKYSKEDIRICLKIFRKDDFYLFPESQCGNRLLEDFMNKFREEMFAG